MRLLLACTFEWWSDRAGERFHAARFAVAKKEAEQHLLVTNYRSE